MFEIQRLKLWLFIHNNIMQSQFHGAEQIVIKGWAQDALIKKARVQSFPIML
jgi:hypothetical protein